MYRSARPRLALVVAVALVAAGTATSAAGPSPTPDPGEPSAAAGGPGSSPGPAPSPGSALGRLGAPGTELAWTRIEVADGPRAREDHTLTVDPAGDAAYLFGGRDGDHLFGDLWRLDLATLAWTQVAPGGKGPSARFGHAAAWMDGLGLVVFGGESDAGFHADLWAFDPVTVAWRRLPGKGAAPVARYGTCASVGPDGRLWVSHGFTADGRFDDTRAWDAATGRWRDRSPTGDRPVVRCLHDCLWTPDGRLVLFGGQTDGRPALGDLWTYDPASRRWTRGAGPGPTPTARRLYALASGGAEAWLVGGRDRDDDPLEDVWRLDLATRSFSRPVLAEGAAPAGRSGATLVLDRARDRLVLFGGEGRTSVLADLWTLAPLAGGGAASPSPVPPPG